MTVLWLARSVVRDLLHARLLAIVAAIEVAFVLLGSTMPSIDEGARSLLAERVGLAGGLLALGAVAGASGASLIAEEVRSGRAAYWLARPVPRPLYVLGRLAGLIAVLAIAAIVAAVAHGIAMASVVRTPEGREAITSRRSVPERSVRVEGSGEAQRLVVEFPRGPLAGGDARLRGELELASPALLSERTATLSLRFLDVPDAPVVSVFVRPRVPFTIDAPAATDPAGAYRVEVDVLRPSGSREHPVLGARSGSFSLLLERRSSIARVATSFTLVLLTSATVAAVAVAASSVLSMPVALAIAVVVFLLGHAPDAIPSAARFALSPPQPSVAEGPRRPGAPGAVIRVVDVVARAIPNLEALWPGDALDRSESPTAADVLARIACAWPQAAAALLVAIAIFSRRDLGS